MNRSIPDRANAHHPTQSGHFGLSIGPIIAVLVVIAGVVALRMQEPLSERKVDITNYVKHHDGIAAVVLGHTRYASGGTAWFVQPKNDKYLSFTVVDNGFFRTHISSGDYKVAIHRP